MKIKIFLLLFCSIFLIPVTSAQKSNKKSPRKITISGYVVDQTQKPVAYAYIMLDDAKTDLFTNSKGFYKIKVKPDVKKIGIFTSTNGLVEEPVNGRTRINFTFTGSVPDQANPNGKLPADQEVNVGYGTVKKRNLTSPVNEIDATESKYASYRTIYDVLRSGSIPGIQVVGNSIKIQGASSLTLSTEPLFVVDGVPVETVDNIPPYMVKSIQVLKGPSAAIYGSRGANGVILINLLKAGDTK
jgi:TonB-dependent SusC/RagA subfamily outer membrane receptor